MAVIKGSREDKEGHIPIISHKEGQPKVFITGISQKIAMVKHYAAL